MDPNPYPRFKAFVDSHYLPHFGGPALPREDPQRAIGCFIGSLAMWLEKYDTREVLKKQIAELRAVINTERTEVVSLAERLLIESSTPSEGGAVPDGGRATRAHRGIGREYEPGRMHNPPG